MYVKREMGFNDLKNNSWSGAVDTLNKIEEEGKEDEFMDYLEGIFEEAPDETELNDYLWFDADQIFEDLGMNENNDEEE